MPDRTDRPHDRTTTFTSPDAGQRRRFGFRRFQTNLLAVILLLVITLQGLVFFTVSGTARRSAVQASEDALRLTAGTLKNTLAEREAYLRKYARLLSHDYVFKSLLSEDHETLLSAFSSYQRRLGAEWLVLVGLDGMVLADTLHTSARNVPFAYPELLAAARTGEGREVSKILFQGGKAYQTVLVPLDTPAQVAWVGIGYAITDRLADELERQTLTQVSLTWQTPGRPATLLASTLDAARRADFLRGAGTLTAGPDSQIARLAGDEYVSMALPLQRGGGALTAVMQRPLAEAMAGYRELRWQLLAVFVLSTLGATVAVVFIARRVTRPVLMLADAAERISGGGYGQIDPLGRSAEFGRSHEFGAVAAAFDNMVRGLVERDQARSLLGKVVSPAIAEELLSRRIEFGGQEQEVSLLFSDIQGFTSLSEGRSPSTILAMLNTYLSEMSALVDAHGGVVDKYIGDAVMALFGAPLVAEDDPQRAVLAALAMVAAMPELNRKFAAMGWPPLSIRVGIHSGNVVAGNIGSETRSNYTVLGDTVNLASRLEGLCKRYAVGIIASASTMRRCKGIAFRELDRVRVRGKREAVGIYEPLGMEQGLGDGERAALARHAAAMLAYRQGRFAEALAGFESLQEDGVGLLYRARCARWLAQPPGPDWDGIETPAGMDGA